MVIMYQQLPKRISHTVIVHQQLPIPNPTEANANPKPNSTYSIPELKPYKLNPNVEPEP